MKRTAVQLVQDAWTAGKDGTPVDGIGAEAARMDAARVGNKRKMRQMKQDLTTLVAQLSESAHEMTRLVGVDHE